MNKKEITNLVVAIFFVAIDLYLYLSDPLKRGMRFPLILFFLFLTLSVFYRKNWTKVLFTILLILICIAYFLKINLAILNI